MDSPASMLRSSRWLGNGQGKSTSPMTLNFAILADSDLLHQDIGETITEEVDEVVPPGKDSIGGSKTLGFNTRSLGSNRATASSQGDVSL